MEKKKRGNTIEDIRAIKELEHISDEEAKEIIRSLKVFAEICYSYYMRRYAEEDGVLEEIQIEEGKSE